MEQIEKQKGHPDRPLWLLAAAEKLALNKGDAKRAKQYLEDAQKAVKDMPAGQQQESCLRQIKRIETLLVPA